MSTDDALPWTTSRCNRLLRPLSSKLAKLRKEIERPQSLPTELRSVSSAFATKGIPSKTTNFTRPTHKPKGFEKAEDPDWRPGAKSAPSKKTYGGRGGKKLLGLQRNRASTRDVSPPGAIAFTPLIARMGGQLQSSPTVQMSPLKKYGKNRGPLLVGAEPFQSGRHMHADLHKLVHGLLEAYANLLQATTTGHEKQWKGTRSLMGACLRTLPAYIDLEEHFAKMDKLDEDDETEERDVGNEVYEHLETQFEQRPGQGWRPFRQVVRAHATSLLCHAIQDRILGLDSLSIMITHCLNAAAWDEAERILLAYVPLMIPVSMPACIKADLFHLQRQPFLSLFKGFVERTGRYRLLYNLLEHMVAWELLPLEWLATECMRPVWDRLVRAISDNDPRTVDSAYQFMETATLASMGLPDARLLEDKVPGSVSRRFVPSSREELRLALSTTFSSLLTVLCSIALVSSHREDPVGKLVAQRIERALDATLIALSTREHIYEELLLLDADVEDVQVFAQRALWANFASLVVHLEGCNHTGARLALTAASYGKSINWTAAQFNVKGVNFATVFSGLPSVIASIARSTGRIWQDDGFDQIQRLVAAFMSTSGFRLPHKLWTLKRLALESAMEFAYSTGDVEHMVFARSIEQTMRNQGRLVIAHSPDKDAPPTASGGFKWEEGIGEWVACTPFAKQNVKRQPRNAIRPLDLLPTPGPSEDEMAGQHETKSEQIHDSSIWNTTAFDSDDEGEAVPNSSPIKKAPRIPLSSSSSSSSSLRKRRRASSPIVLIPAKRFQLTPPDMPGIPSYPKLQLDKPHRRQQGRETNALRRPRRSTRHRHTLSSRRSTHRPRTSLEYGLRNLRRSTYTEHDEPEKVEEDEEEEDDDEEDNSFSSSPSSTRPTPNPQHALSRTRLSHRTRTSNHHQHHEIMPDELGTIISSKFIPKRSAFIARKRLLHAHPRPATIPDSDASDSEDELSLL